MKFISRSEGETESLGERLGSRLRAGDVLALYGGLGAGKTAFVRGVARGLGIQGRVTSPTFTLVNEYEGRIPLFHFDLYRLSGSQELFDLGWDEYLDRGGVCAVEWSENARELFDSIPLRLRFLPSPGKDTWREIIMEGDGSRFADFIA